MDMKQFIDEKLEALHDDSYYEQKQSKFTITLPAEHKFMLEELAAAFGGSLTSLSGEILVEALNEAVFHVPQPMLEKIIPAVEQKTIEHYQKTFNKFEYKGDVTRWPHYLRCVRGEFDNWEDKQ